MINEFQPDQALVNRLLMTLDPLFFSYDEDKQNTLRQRFGWTYSDQIYSYLYRELFSLVYDENDDEDILSDSQLRLLNAYTTALAGIGENSFRLNELQGESFDLTAFESLYDYDLSEFEYQRQAWERESPGSWANKPYRLYLNHNWARILDSNGDFYYSTLSSLSRYLYDELENEKSDIIKTLIPHEYVDGPNHGKNVDGGMVWDIKIDANGLEPQLDELKSRSQKYLNSVCEDLQEEFHQDDGKAVYFLKGFDDPHSPRWDIVVKNSETAKHIRFQTLLNDCQKNLQPIEQIEAIKRHAAQKLRQYIIEVHRDILENFDPSVLPFKKEMKVVMSPGALDDLARLNKEDEP